jgi:hypothetical protein
MNEHQALLGGSTATHRPSSLSKISLVVTCAVCVCLAFLSTNAGTSGNTALAFATTELIDWNIPAKYNGLRPQQLKLKAMQMRSDQGELNAKTGTPTDQPLDSSLNAKGTTQFSHAAQLASKYLIDSRLAVGEGSGSGAGAAFDEDANGSYGGVGSGSGGGSFGFEPLIEDETGENDDKHGNGQPTVDSVSEALDDDHWDVLPKGISNGHHTFQLKWVPDTDTPTSAPTDTPTKAPTAPTGVPSSAPTKTPTPAPTSPTEAPTTSPTGTPTTSPTLAPTAPTKTPTMLPTIPTLAPTLMPTTTAEPITAMPKDGDIPDIGSIDMPAIETGAAGMADDDGGMSQFSMGKPMNKPDGSGEGSGSGSGLGIPANGAAGMADDDGGFSQFSMGKPMGMTTHAPTSHPCDEGTHDCDTHSTQCEETVLGGVACACLEGFTTNAASTTSCTATDAPTPEPTHAPTHLPSFHPCDDGTNGCDTSTTQCEHNIGEEGSYSSYSAEEFTCACLEGYAADPTSMTSCTAVPAPTPMQTSPPFVPDIGSAAQEDFLDDQAVGTSDGNYITTSVSSKCVLRSLTTSVPQLTTVARSSISV